MTVARKLAILPLVSLVGILLISVVLMRDIRSVYHSASYGNDFAVPNLLTLEQIDSNFVGVRLNVWQHVATSDAAGMATLPPECRHEPPLALDGGPDGIAIVRRIIDNAGRHLTRDAGLLCEVGRDRPVLEQTYPDTSFLWLDTEESSGEVFWLDAAQL